MKKFVKILLGIVLVAVVAVAAIFYFTADMVTIADGFFAAVKNKDVEKAYTYLSEDFKSGTSKADLESYLKETSISNYGEASWDSRSFSGNRGTLVGSITTDSGGVIPITLTLVKGEQGWKIYSIQKPLSGIQEESTPTQVPSEQEQVKLAAQAMHVFAESVKAKSMKKFHSYTSNMWQQQTTVENLDEAFGVFLGSDMDLTVLDNFSPTFDSKPAIDEDGVLVIAGHYATKPNQVHFRQRYIYEGLGWKLLGFSINVK